MFDPYSEYDLLPLEGELEADDERFTMNGLIYLGDGRDDL